MTRTLQFATGSRSLADGRGRGVAVHALELGEGAPVVRELGALELPDPSFVLWHPAGELLYAITETAPARLLALRAGADGGLEVARELRLGGTHPVHLALGATPCALHIAHYGSGEVETVSLDADGLPLETVDLDRHGSADARAAGFEAHPHEAVLLPGTDLLAVPDLGLDRVYLHRRGAAGNVDLAGEISLQRGSGPRHLAADHESSALYISCELSGGLATAHRAPREVGADAGGRPGEQRWCVRSVVPATGREGDCAPSHVALSADEAHLLIANRGVDTLALFSLADARPALVDEVEVGAWPRHFALAGDLVLVAAEGADRIDLLRVRGDRLEPAGDPIASPSVTCIAVRPEPAR